MTYRSNRDKYIKYSEYFPFSYLLTRIPWLSTSPISTTKGSSGQGKKLVAKLIYIRKMEILERTEILLQDLNTHRSRGHRETTWGFVE